MTHEHRFVSGIYNYCDSWCARCAFTLRCRNYAMGCEIERKADGGKPVEDSEEHEGRWPGLGPARGT